MLRKKILVLASTFPRWANDTTPPFVLELEKRLTNDFDIFLLAPHFPGAKKNECMDNINVRRFQYFWPATFQKLCYGGGILPNLKKNKWLLVQAVTLIFFEILAAINLVRKKNIELIHAHWLIPQGIIALILKKMFQIPYIVTVHGGDIFGLQNNFLNSIKKSILKNADKITVVSTAIKKEIHIIDPNLDVYVVSMGVDANLFNTNKFDKSIKTKFTIHGPFLLFVGRLAEKKGVKYLLRAMPDIIKAFPKTILLIIGEGTIKIDLEKLTNVLGIRKNVFFVGGIPNAQLPNYYATADIFIGPSIQTKDGDTEGLGLTFVEASFSGAIPIGTVVGGISDVIKNNKTGFLVPQKSSYDIAETVIKVLKNPERMSQVKSNARAYVYKKFDWETVTTKYKKFYESCI